MSEATEVIEKPNSEVVPEEQAEIESGQDQANSEQAQLDNEVKYIFSKAKDEEDMEEVREALDRESEGSKDQKEDDISSKIRKGEILYHGTRYDFEGLPKNTLIEPDHVTHAYGSFYTRKSDIANYLAEAYYRPDLRDEYGEGGKVYPVTPKEDLTLFNLAGKMTPEVESSIINAIKEVEPSGRALPQLEKTLWRSGEEVYRGATYLDAMEQISRLYLPEDYKHDRKRFVTDVFRKAGFDGIDAEGNWRPDHELQGGSAEGIQIFDDDKVETQWGK